jgi:hypothetical protein
MKDCTPSSRAPTTSLLSSKSWSSNAHWSRRQGIQNRGNTLLLSRQAYAAADTSRFLVDGTGLIYFSESFTYLSSIINFSYLGRRRLQAHQIGYTSRFLVDGTGILYSSGSFEYVGSIIH